MRINRIKLCNISSYSGICEFDFSVTDKRNVVLIGGQNGTGKTSLFTAIKLALYGPLCFHFQSKNNQYTAKIKELISHDAFAQPEVNAFVELEMELPKDRTSVQYIIRRDWTYEDQKLSEQDSVLEDGIPLSEREMDYFQNYLHSVLPPNLFDFFFFDGEELAGFFASSNYSSYLRNAVLTLDSYDSFHLIERFCRRYVAGDKDSEQAKVYREEYDRRIAEQDEEEAARQKRKERAQELEALQKDCARELEDLHSRYQKRGGLSQKRRRELEKESAALEAGRAAIGGELKDFVENMLPLALTLPVARPMGEQLAREEEMQQYLALEQRMSPERLRASLEEVLDSFGIGKKEEFLRVLSQALTGSVKPEGDSGDFRFLHSLSQEQRGQVVSVLGMLDRFDQDHFVGLIRAKQESAERSNEIRKTLEGALSVEEVRIYEEQERALLDRQAAMRREQEDLEEAQKAGADRLEQLEKRIKSLKASLVGLTRRVEAQTYTEKISRMMTDMLGTLMEGKRRAIERETLRLTKEILRKEHFIDLIELDEKFNFSLYRAQTYTYDELVTLFENIGADEVARRIGGEGVKVLQERFRADSIRELRSLFKRDRGQSTLRDRESFALYKRIEFQQLSKGEKQIFILSLYWAIIKSAGRDIPFIIDTPYARIDMEHRDQLTRKFFPAISGQVIILSTDEEITQPYYKMLRSHIAQEYTLQYNETLGRTEVTKGYSFGGERA